MQYIFLPLLMAISVFMQHLPGNTHDFAPLSTLPTLYQGRYIPIDVYSKNFLNDNHIELSETPLHQALLLHMLGHDKLGRSNNVIVNDPHIRSLLKIDSKVISYARFTAEVIENPELYLKFMELLVVSHFWEEYNKQGTSKLTLPSLHPQLVVHYANNSITLKEIPVEEPWRHLQKGQVFAVTPELRQHYQKLREPAFSLLRSITTIKRHTSADSYSEEYLKLKSIGLSPEIISSTLNQKYPLIQRITSTSPSFYMLPDKSTPEVWHPLKTINLQVYDETKNSLIPVSNFTAYSNEDFEKIRLAFIQFQSSLPKGSYDEEIINLSDALHNAYHSMITSPYIQTSSGSLFFPTPTKLKIESIYSRISWTQLLIITYLCSLIALMMPLKKYSYLPLIIAFSLHTTALLTRCYLLGRPPVSNMTETVLFVPWISVIAGAALTYAYRSKIPLSCASAGAAALLFILTLSGKAPPLENVQAVLNSQFWLTIHVLMIVGSYGAFLLSGLLGHLYLLLSHKKSITPSTMTLIGKLTLQSIYLGLALLIPGTILGGVWAAQSWGRFWDWDPKESWAFISCCTYLIIVHAHYFGILKSYGVAIGSVIGLMVVAFTWYGVNYILGTGLHSYGFGNGGEHLFYLYLVIETIFLAINSILNYTQRPSSGFKTP